MPFTPGVATSTLRTHTVSGAPDVVFFDRVNTRLSVAVGGPGKIDAFDTKTMERLGSCATEKGAHSFALARDGGQLHAFLPASHRAAISGHRRLIRN